MSEFCGEHQEGVPAYCIYDPQADQPTIGESVAVSRVIRTPSAIQVDTIADDSELALEAKVVEGAEWAEMKVFDSSNTPDIVMFDVELNFVRVRLKSGGGAVKAYIQT